MASIINSDDGVISGTAGLKSTGANDGALNIQTNGSNAISISSGQRSTFPTTIGVGGATPSTSGSGISFPATASASSDANTLDDYEEGTWTPAFTAATVGNLSVSYSFQNGVYTKIGNLVTVTGFVVTSAFTHTTASGVAQITGLPFTAIATVVQPHGGTSYTGYTKANFPQVVAIVAQTDNKVTFYSCGSAQTRVSTAITDFPSGGTVSLAFTITYTV